MLPGGAEVAEVVDGDARGREGERLELFVESSLEVVLGGEADRYVGVEPLAGFGELEEPRIER